MAPPNPSRGNSACSADASRLLIGHDGSAGKAGADLGVMLQPESVVAAGDETGANTAG